MSRLLPASFSIGVQEASKSDQGHFFSLFGCAGMLSARWPVSGAQPPVRSGHRALLEQAVERSDVKMRLVSFPWKFTKASLYTFRYRPLNPLPLGSTLLPPAPSQKCALYRESPVQGKARRQEVSNSECALYRESPVQAPRGLNCPVQGIPCTGAWSFQEHSKRFQDR